MCVKNSKTCNPNCKNRVKCATQKSALSGWPTYDELVNSGDRPGFRHGELGLISTKIILAEKG
ncbi:hypothetical protein GR11A_00186 [Vibrio phage vB_VcorM_GR11A]|nr:hypothetical protein GR11A_00186 [Vibrio phage vB_VcorM_GR11A]